MNSQTRAEGLENEDKGDYWVTQLQLTNIQTKLKWGIVIVMMFDWSQWDHKDPKSVRDTKQHLWDFEIWFYNILQRPEIWIYTLTVTRRTVGLPSIVWYWNCLDAWNVGTDRSKHNRTAVYHSTALFHLPLKFIPSSYGCINCLHHVWQCTFC